MRATPPALVHPRPPRPDVCLGGSALVRPGPPAAPIIPRISRVPVGADLCVCPVRPGPAPVPPALPRPSPASPAPTPASPSPSLPPLPGGEGPGVRATPSPAGKTPAHSPPQSSICPRLRPGGHPPHQSPDNVNPVRRRLQPVQVRRGGCPASPVSAPASPSPPPAAGPGIPHRRHSPNVDHVPRTGRGRPMCLPSSPPASPSPPRRICPRPPLPRHHPPPPNPPSPPGRGAGGEGLHPITRRKNPSAFPPTIFKMSSSECPRLTNPRIMFSPSAGDSSPSRYGAGISSYDRFST